jgi:hypothetical protein
VQSEKLVTLAAVLDQIYGRERAAGDTREEAIAEVLAESAVGL